MPQPRYITSESQMGAPGVYVIETAPAVPTRGQRNRVIGLAGQCLRGPTGKTVTCTDYQRFLDVFGGRDRNTNGGAVAGHVWRALQGRRWGKLVIARVAAADAVAASFTLETAAGGGGTPVLRIDASSVGAWGGDVGIKVGAATDGDANHFNLYVRLYGKVKTYENVDIHSTNDNTNQKIGNDDATLIRVTKLAAGRPVNHAAGVDGADSDGYVLLGQVVASFTSVVGSDGTVDATDYTDPDGPMELLNEQVGVHACAVVGWSDSDIKDKVETLAALASQRVWFVCPDDETVVYTDAVTERATFSTDRMSYWFNHAYVTDPATLEEVVEEPFLCVLGIISQTDPDVHPGDFDNAIYTKAIRRTAFELGNTKRDALNTGGVSFIWRDQDSQGNEVIVPGNALTCDFARNNKALDGRYMKDFILDAIAQRLRGDQFKGNTPDARANRAGSVSSFLEGLARKGRYIQMSEGGVPQFSYTNDSSVNSAADQADGDQTERVIATLIPKNIRMLLNATIGTDAVVSES